MSGYEWVGWRNDMGRGSGQPVELIFEFDSVRNFSALHIYANNLFTLDTSVFSKARVSFSVAGEHYHTQPMQEYHYPSDRIFESARNVSIRLDNQVGKFVKLQLFFALKWMLISEVSFDSGELGVKLLTLKVMSYKCFTFLMEKK